MGLDGLSFFVTGGTGSFGRTVVRTLLAHGADRVTVFSRDEKKQNEMAARFNDRRLNCVIGDVRDYSRLQFAMRGHDAVFSAAALKVVPSCERHPTEAIRTNTLGVENVCRAAAENQVATVCLLSTDKACYPINAMGQTKALAEKIVAAYSRDIPDTKFSIVRYGNVAGSRGSVLEIWRTAILAGQPITVCDPSHTRFLMLLSDAVGLVLETLAGVPNGSILVQKAKAATMQQLANSVIKYFGKGEIIISEPRPGEKKHEVLVTQEESLRAVDHKNGYCIYPDLPKKYGVRAVSEVPFLFSSLSAPRFSDDELLILIEKAYADMDVSQ